ncbi:endoplasmic reticulum resident protein 27 isoform X3 [Zootoca vivipara]|uniref:endoplasmic reticulum resident protein 27 isoform X3 n=1 Tax=Zootoca vivipara TaxID=8524 RepID=UPI001591E127|nr:endoplasmic reticulum resident protein 27 isoform X3 [Zootoca vivipara]
MFHSHSFRCCHIRFRDRWQVTFPMSGSKQGSWQGEKRGKAMKTSVLQQWFLASLLSCVFMLGCAVKEPAPKGTPEDARKPVQLENVAAAAAFVSTAEVVVVGFFQDPERPELSEFLKMVQDMQDVPFGLCTSSNVLSHYNVTTNTISLFRMTAVGLFNSTIQTHLLLFTDKSSPKHVEMMDKYREAAVLFQGKILFISVDVRAKGNDRVMSYFHLKKSQLPALAAYHTPDEEQEVLSMDEVSLETVRGFCNGFLQRKELVSAQDDNWADQSQPSAPLSTPPPGNVVPTFPLQSDV